MKKAPSLTQSTMDTILHVYVLPSLLLALYTCNISVEALAIPGRNSNYLANGNSKGLRVSSGTNLGDQLQIQGIISDDDHWIMPINATDGNPEVISTDKLLGGSNLIPFLLPDNSTVEQSSKEQSIGDQLQIQGLIPNDDYWIMPTNATDGNPEVISTDKLLDNSTVEQTSKEQSIGDQLQIQGKISDDDHWIMPINGDQLQIQGLIPNDDYWIMPTNDGNPEVLPYDKLPRGPHVIPFLLPDNSTVEQSSKGQSIGDQLQNSNDDYWILPINDGNPEVLPKDKLPRGSRLIPFLLPDNSKVEQSRKGQSIGDQIQISGLIPNDDYWIMPNNESPDEEQSTTEQSVDDDHQRRNIQTGQLHTLDNDGAPIFLSKFSNKGQYLEEELVDNRFGKVRHGQDIFELYNDQERKYHEQEQKEMKQNKARGRTTLEISGKRSDLVK